MPNIIATAAAENNGEHYSTKLTSGLHQLFADEPELAGGRNSAPAPGDFLCMALASCKTITLRMYAERKKWDVGQIKVKAELVKGTDTPSGNNTLFCEISFAGKITEEQKNRLLQIAKSCPISRLLSKTSEVVTIVL